MHLVSQTGLWFAFTPFFTLIKAFVSGVLAFTGLQLLNFQEFCKLAVKHNHKSKYLF